MFNSSFATAATGAFTMSLIQNNFVWAAVCSFSGIFAYILTESALVKIKGNKFSNLVLFRPLLQFSCFPASVSFVTVAALIISSEMSHGLLTRTIEDLANFRLFGLAIVLFIAFGAGCPPYVVFSSLKANEIKENYHWLAIIIGSMMPLGSLLMLLGELLRNFQ
jgi:hypothetical protein